MRTVSKEYKEKMHEITREQMYMEVNIGLINQEAQSSGSISSDVSVLSNVDVFEKSKIQLPYTTLEHKYFRVDGMQLFPPEKGTTPKYFNGLISNELSDTNGEMEGCFFEISFPQSVYPLDIKGLTLQFYWFYPVEFDVIWGENIKSFTNDSMRFVTDAVFENVCTPIKLVPKKMSGSYCRCRIENIKFGIGLNFTNTEIKGSTLITYTHPISNNLPYKSFTLTVDDRASIYDLENPNSPINFMEQMQKVEIRAGLRLSNGNIEWMKLETLNLSEWISERSEATFKAVDTLSFYEEQYIKGQYYSSGISLYDLAIDVLNDMGLEEEKYELDSYLETVIVKNPLPICKHKEALQIIANAGRCYMSQDQDGKIYIVSNFEPSYEFESADKTSYSKLENVKDGTVTDYYATFEAHAMPVNGMMKLIPDNAPYNLNTGYISESLSGLNGIFKTSPVITIQAEARMKTFGLSIVFGLTVCTSFMIKTYRNNTEVESLLFENYDKQFEVLREWKEFDRMDIHFQSTEHENQRIYVDCIRFGDVTDYYISNKLYLETTPRGKLNTKVRNLLISSTNYAKNDTEESLVDKEVTYAKGQEDEVITFSNPVYGLRCEGATILESGTYYVKIRKPSTTDLATKQIKVFGNKYNIASSSVSYLVNEKGSDTSFDNPLIDSANSAYELANWIATYIGEQKDYTFDWRGDPSVESNDIVYIQNTFLDKMKLRVLKNTINYNGGALSGSIEGRKVGGA